MLIRSNYFIRQHGACCSVVCWFNTPKQSRPLFVVFRSNLTCIAPPPAPSSLACSLTHAFIQCGVRIKARAASSHCHSSPWSHEERFIRLALSIWMECMARDQCVSDLIGHLRPVSKEWDEYWRFHPIRLRPVSIDWAFRPSRLRPVSNEQFRSQKHWSQ